MDFHGKAALVTGASRGIGLATAVNLAKGGAALALVIFASWRSLNTIWGSCLFGILYWLFFYIGGLTRYSQELFKMLPYVVTIIVLVVTSMRKKKENMGPAALGLSYFREDR